MLAALRRGGGVVSSAACSFVEGLETLPRAMAAGLGERVRLEMPVRTLTPRSGGWRVASEAAELDAKAVVLTTPAGVTARLLKNVAPDAARRARSLRYNPLAVVHLHSAANLGGFGFQVSLAEDLSLRGVTFNHSLFERVDVYTAFLGGSRRPQLVQLPDDELARLAVAEFRLCTGFDARALAVSRQAMPAWDRSWSALQGFELPRGIHVASNWVSRPGLPGRFADAAVLAEELSSKR